MALLLFSGLSMLTNTKDEAKQLREDGWRDDEIEGLGPWGALSLPCIQQVQRNER